MFLAGSISAVPDVIMASPGAKDVQFGHWLPAHALSSAGFRFGAGTGGTAGAELAYILLNLFIYLRYVGYLLYVLIISNSSYLNGNFTFLYDI